LLWVYGESEEEEEESKGWNDRIMNRERGNEKNHKTKKKNFGFFYSPRP
jgi:hypothetical protein